MNITITELEKLVKDVLLTKYSEEDTNLIAEVILFAEISGRRSHGIMRLLSGSYGAMVDGIEGQPEYTYKSKVSTVIDAKRNPAMLVGALAVNEVIRLAQESGIGLVGTKNTHTSTGALSYYVEKMAKHNFVGVVASQTSPMVSAFHTKNPVFGTNPLAFGFPREKGALIFDMATSAITFGGIKNAQLAGEKLPDNVAIDSDGNITTDALKALDGAILPFYNTYKGSGLAMMVEVLGGVFSGAGFVGLHQENGDGNLFIAISPDLLSDTGVFKKHIEELVQTLKSQETVDGSHVRIPGEHTLQTRDENIAKGFVDVDEKTLEKVKNLLTK
jgi:L-2-hydroxycarboxylate dehydrogenase (NAD+)